MLWNRRIVAPTAVVLAAAALAAGSADASVTATRSARAKSARQPNSAVEIGTAKIGALGNVLVRGNGHALYLFLPDAGTRSGCSNGCQKIWGLVTAPSRGVARAIAGARQSLVGSVRDPVTGGRVVTYDGWPLYTYVLDQHAGQANGQGIAMGGGHWYVLTASGKPIRRDVSRGIEVGS
ncbi:MAG TPA: hypothetical protein VG293_00990 [Solirubrobacteraceae bacterium]|nr:hypothetical protein [Solirubrobacteraceae bacterium]